MYDRVRGKSTNAGAKTSASHTKLVERLVKRQQGVSIENGISVVAPGLAGSETTAVPVIL
jgi:hypothetical protein